MTETDHPTHPHHDHEHGPACGHVAVRHEDHTDYLHDGHLHHPHADHVDEHQIPVDGEHPSQCAPPANAEGHPADHEHGPQCGHEPVPHGDHVDYLVDARLHHPHGGHCDDHGMLTLA